MNYASASMGPEDHEQVWSKKPPVVLISLKSESLDM